MRRFFRRYWLALAIPAVFVAAWVLLWNIRETRSGMITVLVFQDLLLDTPAGPLRVLGGDPMRQEVFVYAPKGRGEVPADVYVPAGNGRRGAMIISVGAAQKIRDHPGVIRFANTFSRAGIVVMIPQLYYPYRESTLPDDVEELVDAFGTNIEEVVASFQWLREQPYVDPERVGIFGVSAGGGVGLIAASDERIRKDVHFVTALGTYFDMVDLINSITTESISYDGWTEPWEPRVKAVRVLYRSIISFLPDGDDREVLTRIFVEEEAAAREELWRLSEKGMEIYGAFEDKDPDRILGFWSEVSPRDVDTLRDISPSKYVANLHAELFIMTDRSDPYIPFVESRRLRDAAAGNGNQIHYAEFDFLNHVEPSSPSNPIVFLTDLLKVLYYSWLLMLRLY